MDAVLAVIGKQGWGECYIAPGGPESCKEAAFSCICDAESHLTHACSIKVGVVITANVGEVNSIVCTDSAERIVFVYVQLTTL